MQFIAQQFEQVRKALLLGVGGLNCAVLEKLAEQGIMPNVARILPSMGRAALRQPFFSSPSASWAMLESGPEIHCHNVLDDVIFDPSRRCLAKRVPSHFTSRVVWHRKPADERELDHGIAQTIGLLQKSFDEVRSAHASCKSRLTVLKLTVLDSLFLRLWQLLGIDEGPGGRRSSDGSSRPCRRRGECVARARARPRRKSDR
jgi:hypothetical protein